MAQYTVNDAPKIKQAVQEYDNLVALVDRAIAALQRVGPSVQTRYPRQLSAYNRHRNNVLRAKSMLVGYKRVRDNASSWLQSIGTTINGATSNVIDWFNQRLPSNMQIPGLGIGPWVWVTGIIISGAAIAYIVQVVSDALTFSQNMVAIDNYVAQGFDPERAQSLVANARDINTNRSLTSGVVGQNNVTQTLVGDLPQWLILAGLFAIVVPPLLQRR